MIDKELLKTILSTHWSDECDTVGRQYVDYIIQHATVSESASGQLFEKSEGKHAFGIGESVQILLAAVTLIVNGLQLASALRQKADLEKFRSELEAKATTLLEDSEKAKAFTEDILKEVASDGKPKTRFGCDCRQAS